MNRLFKQNIEGFLFTRSHEHIQLLKQLLLETLLKTKIELLEKTTKLGDDMNNVICLPQIQQVFIYLFVFKHKSNNIWRSFVSLYLYDFAKVDGL